MKHRMQIILIVLLILASPQILFAQSSEPTIPQIQTMAKLFEGQHLLVLRHANTVQWGDYDDEQIRSFSAYAESIRSMLENPRDFSNASFQEHYQQYNAYSKYLYSDETDYETTILIPFVYPIQKIQNEIFDKDLKEYFKRLDIRYGEDSEKLNLLEIALSNAFFSPRTTGSQINYPKVTEPILRMQAVGYQYYGDSEEFLPSSPIFQAGLSFYLYGDTKFQKWVNHIGIAAAYERDLITNSNYFGGMLHIKTFDIGLLYDPETKEKILAASFNVQLIKGVF